MKMQSPASSFSDWKIARSKFGYFVFFGEKKLIGDVFTLSLKAGSRPDLASLYYDPKISLPA